jgi:hypothetical protein
MGTPSADLQEAEEESEARTLVGATGVVRQLLCASLVEPKGKRELRPVVRTREALLRRSLECAICRR